MGYDGMVHFLELWKLVYNSIVLQAYNKELVIVAEVHFMQITTWSRDGLLTQLFLFVIEFHSCKNIVVVVHPVFQVGGQNGFLISNWNSLLLREIQHIASNTFSNTHINN